MCGIAGYWNFRTDAPAAEHVIRGMVETLRHRGPDDSGHHLDGSLAVGMRRLQVVDLEGGHQPMSNEDGSIWSVFNGEIYNHAELRHELQRCGHRFRTRSDTEAIVHAFEEWGLGCFERFNGMFAVGIWDSVRQRLVLARDRLGIKPLYVFDGPEGVVFGSELKAVIAAPWVPVEWDLEAVDDFITYEFVPTPLSLVRGVRKLPQGSYMLVRRDPGGNPVTSRYWQLEADGDEPTTPRQAATELSRRLGASVQRRLMADVPVGAFLSGGVDSSIVVGEMNRARPGEVRSFSLGFADRSYDELPFSRSVAAHFATQHVEEMVQPEIVQMAGRLADYFDEPFGDVSAFPTYMISEMARAHVTVVLSGDGGDELFAGYDHYRAHRWAERLRWASRTWGWHVADKLLTWLPPSRAKKGPINKAKRFVEGVRRPSDLEHARWWVFWDLAERRALYGTEMASELRGRDCFGYYRRRLAEGAEQGFTALQRQLYADVTGYLADDILVKVDRMSMAVSLEARVPFLDHEVVEYAMRIPDRWKVHSGESKWILKEAYRDMLPAMILRRGKEGFSMPMKNWLRAELRPMMEDLLSNTRLRDRGWFDPDEVKRLRNEHVTGRENHAHRLWCLMSLELALGNLTERAKQRTSLLREVRS